MKHATQFFGLSKNRTAWQRRIALVSAVLALVIGLGAVWQQTAQAEPGAITITVDTSEDLVATSLTHTCGYEEGAFFFPAADGKCTLRRALREAGARPDTDRPITIAMCEESILSTRILT